MNDAKLPPHLVVSYDEQPAVVGLGPEDEPQDVDDPIDPSTRWFWVRIRARDPDIIAWRRTYCDGLPFDHVEWMPDEGAPPSPAQRPAPVPRTVSPAQVVRPHRAKVELTDHDVLVDQTTGLMPRKRFLALAKAGAFPAFPEGRLWMVRLSDFQSWVSRQMANRRNTPSSTTAADVDEALLDEIRQKAGLRTKGRR